MSTYWGLRCEDCDENTDHWLNHGDDAIAVIVKRWAIISEAIGYLNRTGHFDVGWPINEIGWFLENHPPGEHKIVLHNEYGSTKEID